MFQAPLETIGIDSETLGCLWSDMAALKFLKVLPFLSNDWFAQKQGGVPDRQKEVLVTVEVFLVIDKLPNLPMVSHVSHIESEFN